MEAAVLSGSIKVLLPKLFSLVEKTYNRDKDIKRDMESLKKELPMIMSTIDDLPKQKEGQLAVLRFWIDDLRELAHGIEDCIDSLVYYATQKQQESYLQKSYRSPKALMKKVQFAQKLRALKKKVVEAHQRVQRYIIPASSATRVDESPPFASDPCMMQAYLVGIDELRAKLLEQLAEDAEGQRKQLKVISIVGCWGLGKTALAADVYNTETGSQRFEKHAWVCAALKPAGEVLADLLRKLSSDVSSSQGSTIFDLSNVGQLCANVRELLAKKR
jgi:disease resistance protein RPM1